MTGMGTQEGPQVALYARDCLAAVPSRRRDEILGRLRELAAEGHVADVTEHTWRGKVPVSETCTETALYEQFRSWAADADVGLDPFFDTRECYSMATGERGTRLVLPVVCLAVYRDGDLESVYPHSTGSTSRSVMDCLRALEAAGSSLGRTRRVQPTR